MSDIPENYKHLLEAIRDKFPNNIGEMIDILREGRCIYCLQLDPKDNCQCWNDE